MNLSAIIKYLYNLKPHYYQGIMFKVIPMEDAVNLGFKPPLEPKINQKDPQIKDLKVEEGSIIATYRDYEKQIDPYYSYRVVQV